MRNHYTMLTPMSKHNYKIFRMRGSEPTRCARL